MHRIRAFADADRKHRAYTCLPRARKQSVAVFVVAWAVEMGVGID
jgi:hypothetical protein